jgi:uncharacterized damage-inducible protein DinB
MNTATGAGPAPMASTLISLYNAVHSDRWDSFLSVLDGVDEEMARWVPEAYSFDLVIEEGWPANGSILWFGNHILACKTGYLHTVCAMDGALPEPEYTFETILAGLRGAAVALHAAFIARLAGLPDSRFGDPVDTDGTTLADHMSNAIRHEAWHSGQMAVIRRLYRWQQRGGVARG